MGKKKAWEKEGQQGQLLPDQTNAAASPYATAPLFKDQGMHPVTLKTCQTVKLTTTGSTNQTGGHTPSPF